MEAQWVKKLCKNIDGYTQKSMRYVQFLMVKAGKTNHKVVYLQQNTHM